MKKLIVSILVICMLASLGVTALAADPTAATAVTEPSVPSAVTEPTVPSSPTEPTAPSAPSQPTAPSAPSQPTAPSAPSQPTAPSTPSQPTAPSTPSQPTAPTTPSQPTAPTTPSQPTAPTTPTKPTDPTKPTEPTEPTFVFPFDDVSEDSWGYEAVYWAAKEGVTKGLSETKFGPEIGCTRAEVVTLIWRQEGCPKATIDKTPFTDLVEDSWYYDAVLWAYENHVTKGTSATTFEPDVVVTRGQFVTLLARNVDKDEVVTETPFTDVDVNMYYAGPIKWAAENGITNGVTKTTFEPDSNCKRIEVVAFLYRYYVAPLPSAAE